MDRVGTLLHHAALNVESVYDRLRWRLRRIKGITRVTLVPYIGYATSDTVYLHGRALSGDTVPPATRTDSILLNALNMLRRFHTHEIRRARVRARFLGQETEVQADVEGYFDVQLALATPLPAEKFWQPMALELVRYAGTPGAAAGGEVMVPPPDAQFAMVSDLDDTVIQTDVLHLVNMARNVFLRNAYTRLPFKGVAAFYRALQRGTFEGQNPIFYLSNSPYNLYDLLVDFFKVRNIPLGPFFLTDPGLAEDYVIRRPAREHKLDHLTRLLERFPHLPFILIGDAGEADAQVYVDALARFPGRIPTIYIRCVTGGKDEKALTPLLEDARARGTELLLVDDTVAAAEHAAQRGYILADALPIIREERREDEEAATAAEQLIADVVPGEERPT